MLSKDKWECRFSYQQVFSLESGSGNTTPSAGTKRKFELTEDAVKEAADKELDKASKRLAEEKARESAPKLSSFWLVRNMSNLGK